MEVGPKSQGRFTDPQNRSTLMACHREHLRKKREINFSTEFAFSTQ
jgi:hypothetical protein